MELLILLGFLGGWATCWIQEQQYLNRLQSDLAQVSETEKALLSQLHSRSETVVVQEMQILKLEEKVLAQERELDLLRYKI
jgi:hypothetical protein